MIGHGEKMTRCRERAIAAILTQPTLAEAAAAARVGESTLRRWLQDKGFRSALSAARRQSMDAAMARLQEACTQAVGTLCAVMSDTEASHASRVSAAKSVIDTAIKVVAIQELEDRLTNLEQQSNTGR